MLTYQFIMGLPTKKSSPGLIISIIFSAAVIASSIAFLSFIPLVKYQLTEAYLFGIFSLVIFLIAITIKHSLSFTLPELAWLAFLIFVIVRLAIQNKFNSNTAIIHIFCFVLYYFFKNY